MDPGKGVRFLFTSRDVGLDRPVIQLHNDKRKINRKLPGQLVGRLQRVQASSKTTGKSASFLERPLVCFTEGAGIDVVREGCLSCVGRQASMLRMMTGQK